MKIFFILFLYISLINSQIIDYENLVPIYRFYDIKKKSHYYTHSQEYSNINFKYQGIEFFAYKQKIDGSVPVYKFTHEQTNTNFLTVNSIPEKRYTNQGISFYAISEKIDSAIPIYRFYHTINKEHFYTRNKIPEKNFKLQGIGFYAVSPTDYSKYNFNHSGKIKRPTFTNTSGGVIDYSEIINSEALDSYGLVLEDIVKAISSTDYNKYNSNHSGKGKRQSYKKTLDESDDYSENSNIQWIKSYDLALENAKKENKPILLNFTGSDWCGWCIRLKKEVFDKKVFKQFASTNLVIVELDFPRNRKQAKKIIAQNQRLQRKYRVRGFPSIILLDSNGKFIKKTGYQAGGAKAYVNHLKRIINYQ